MANLDSKEPYPTDPAKLREACERYENLLTSKGLTDFFRADFFNVDEIRKVLELTQSDYVRIYYGVDENDQHFLFMAPTQADGQARDDVDTTVAPCCCQIPPCPPTESDRYITI